MHMGNVACLVLCLQLWLATSYSQVTPKHNDVACEGGTGEFPSTNITKPLLKVEYFFQNKIIAKSSSPNLSSVRYKDEKLKSRLLIDGNVAFRIEHVTEKDRGEYKIVLTDIYGDRRELVWSLDVTVPGSGKLNITSETNSSNVFRCGEQTGSDLYAWVLINATDVHRRNTKESELTLGDLNQNWSFYCIRLSDCQKSPWFNFTSDEETTIPTPTPTGERTTITTPTPTGERTTITTPTPTGNTIRIVLGVLIPFVVIALLLGVLGFLYWRRKKRAVSENVPTGLSPVNAQYVPVKRSSDAPNGTCNHVETSTFI